MTRLPEAAYWLALTYATSLKLAHVKSIITAWCLDDGRPLAALFELPSERIAAKFGLSPEEAQQVIACAEHTPEQATQLARWQGEGVQLLTRADPRYPHALVRRFPPEMQPLLLFFQGDVRMLGQPSAAVIGARDAGAEMVGFARELSTLLAEEGLVVVSGLGKGIGQAAIEGVLAAEGGRTAAVLPVGINTFAGLSSSAEDLTASVDQGRVLLLSPFHPDAKFTEAQAIARNKLLVRVAEAVFVVAAREAGVARETADEALRIGETVYVWDIDPTVDPTAVGNQSLIGSGALPITGVPDVLEAVEAIVATTLELTEMAETPAAPPPPVTQANEPEVPYDPKTVLDLLSKAGQVPESLARRLQEDQEGEP